MTTNENLEEFKKELGPPSTSSTSSEADTDEADENIDLASVNNAMRRFGTAPVHQTYARKTRAIYVSQQAMMGLQIIATRENLFVSRGTLIGSPSVSELMECIGLGVFNVVPVEGAPNG